MHASDEKNATSNGDGDGAGWVDAMNGWIYIYIKRAVGAVITLAPPPKQPRNTVRYGLRMEGRNGVNYRYPPADDDDCEIMDTSDTRWETNSERAMSQVVRVSRTSSLAQALREKGGGGESFLHYIYIHIYMIAPREERREKRCVWWWCCCCAFTYYIYHLRHQGTGR